MTRRFVGDWGTTRLRLFQLEDGEVAARRFGPGIGQLTLSPAETLLATLGDWAGLAQATGVMLCGMAGSRNGVIEAPYVACPADLADWSTHTAVTVAHGIRIRIAGGLSAVNFAGAPDVMRGEETQIFGALSIDPALASGRRLLVMPGTHSKWVELEDGRVIRFHTSLTGEMFALLRDHSTLTRARTGDDGKELGFAAGLERACETGALLASLFEARAAQLIGGRSRAWALGFLSGLLIGTEVNESLRLSEHRAGPPITLIGAPELNDLYTRALAASGCEATSLEGDRCALAGLAALENRKDEYA